MKITYSTHFEQSPEQIFPYMDDDKLAKQWITALESVEPITEGGNRVGAKARQTYLENGRRFEMVEETLVYEPNRRVKIRSDGDQFSILVDYQLNPENGGTRIDYESEIVPRGLLMRLMLPFARRSMRNGLKNDFERLRGLIGK